MQNPKAWLLAAGGCDLLGEMGAKKTSLRPTLLKKKCRFSNCLFPSLSSVALLSTSSCKIAATTELLTTKSHQEDVDQLFRRCVVIPFPLALKENNVVSSGRLRLVTTCEGIRRKIEIYTFLSGGW